MDDMHVRAYRRQVRISGYRSLEPSKSLETGPPRNRLRTVWPLSASESCCEVVCSVHGVRRASWDLTAAWVVPAAFTRGPAECGRTRGPGGEGTSGPMGCAPTTPSASGHVADHS